MRKSKFAALVKLLSPHLPEARVKLPMIVFPTFQDVLKSLCFESSGSDSDRFYIWVFFMPVCVPANHATFNLGRRIGGKNQRWDLKDPQLVEKVVFSINNDALPFLENVQTPDKAARFALSITGATKSPHVRQANAYLLARAGETEEATKSLDELLCLLDSDTPWQAEMATRARTLMALLLRSPEDAENQLRAWEVETIHNLGLEEVGFVA